MKFKALILLLLLILAVGIALYFRGDFVRFYNDVNKQVKNFQKIDIDSIISETSRQILSPTPLHVGGKTNQVILLKSKVIEETNLQRQLNGLPSLKENAKLNLAAVAKANDMFNNQYFEHQSPLGVDAGKLISSYGYEYISAGENLILGNFLNEKEVVDNWMASPGHRENILNSRYTEIGVAIIKGTFKGETVWIGVQEFALPLSACNQPDANLKAQIDLYKAQLDILSSQIDEKRKQIDDTNPRSAAYSQMIDDYNQLVIRYNSLAEEAKTTIAKYNNQVNIFNNCVLGN